MKIILSPQRRDDQLTLARIGAALVINGKTYDFSGAEEGRPIPRKTVDCEFLVSDVELIDGELQLTLILPHGHPAPKATRFPEPVYAHEDGPIELPPYEVIAVALC